MNEKLTAGNKCLMARDFDMARSLFNEVLKEDPQNVCAIRGKMFCDLKISEIKELKAISADKGKRVPYTRYAKSVPENFSWYFTSIKDYFALASENKLLFQKIVPYEMKITDTETNEYKYNGAKERLFTGHYYRNRHREELKSLPDILGVIVFSIVVPAALIFCLTCFDESLLMRICFFIFIASVCFLFAAPGFKDISDLIRYRSEISYSSEDVEREIDRLHKQLEMNQETLDSSYYKIRDMDQKIMS